MPARINLSEVISALSCALDLTEGQPIGHTMRTCLIGMRLSRELGMNPSDSARLCQLFGTDDLELKPRMRSVDRQNRVSLAVETARTVAMEGGLLDKLRHFVDVARAEDVMKEIIGLRCERGADIAMRLGFPQATAVAVRHLDEHWNGKGHPDGLSGSAIPWMSRIANLSQVVDVFHQHDGSRGAIAIARRRSGTWFDPALVDRVVAWRHESSWWERLDSTDPTDEVIGAEP